MLDLPAAIREPRHGLGVGPGHFGIEDFRLSNSKASVAVLYFSKIGSLQDCPPGHSLVVSTAKNDNKGTCLKCYYIKRGSFQALKMNELVEMLRTNAPLKDKLLALEISRF